MKTSIIEAFLDLVYPPFHPCPHCHRPDTAIHGAQASLCSPCFQGFPFLMEAEKPSGVESLAHYRDSAQSLVHRLKYKEGLYLAKPMASLMVQKLKLEDHQMVIPVPMHRRRLRRRGYNQADLLARNIASMVELTYESNALIRIRETAPMYQLNRLQRIRNMWNSITINQESTHKIQNQKILLVDDVYTTGATAQACIRELEEAGADEVTVVTFALADAESVHQKT
ncbi:MAG: ComF family protein [Tindallia sp. MSAO_Bac2]|nr:MAG: ComF family protein [Tindallia sp. MSAO_Bac2]